MYLGKYYNKFVPSEDIDCPCGEPFQTREHLLCECSRYEDQQHILKEASRDLSLPELLGTKEGIAATAKFLEESGAFTKTGRTRLNPPLSTWEDKPDPRLTDDEDDENG
ncbi:RnaseH domain transposon factor [Mycena sanguinolenta]|uniref:RnaseH domain transposon factor n=1 Tax=Mycena sanguinolenta TaxID=230812 RepID=A0A8H7DN25_9AGAR|nr:RnaseH domain transposon factor [Mycena sanguinolenta]